MIKVDHVFTGALTSTVGPSGTIRRILKNSSKLNEEGIDVSVINHGRIFKSWDDKDFSSFKPLSYSRKHKLKMFLDTRAKKNIMLAIALMEYNRYRIKNTIKQYIRLNRTPDVVVFHGDYEAYYYYKLGQKGNTACFFHSDCLPMEMYYQYYPILRGSNYAEKQVRDYQYVVEKVDRCVFICKKGKENMNKLFPVSISKSALVVNGIEDFSESQIKELNKISINRNDNRIKMVCVGSVSIRKGQRIILEALSKLPINTQERYYLEIIGEGSDLDYCKQFVIDNGLENTVVFLGAIPNIEVCKYLAKDDVFVLMSNNEGLPISIIEALRSGLAVLSTNVSGIPELVTNHNGVLVDVSADSLYKVLQDPDYYDWKRMGKASRELFEQQFTFERMLKDYISMLKSFKD